MLTGMNTSAWSCSGRAYALRTMVRACVGRHAKSKPSPQISTRSVAAWNATAASASGGNSAHALFPPLADAAAAIDGATDLVLIWGEGFDLARLPAQARTIVLDAYAQLEHEHADVFIPVSIQTERRGHYTNFQGVVSAFEPCFPKKPTVADAETLFAAMVATGVSA